MTAVADIYLLAGAISALMEPADFTEAQRQAVRAVVNSGDGESPQATKEDHDIVRALALELCEDADTSDVEHMQRQRY